MEFLVSWKIELEAETMEEAAREALKIIRDKDSDATFFDVTNMATGETEEDVDGYLFEEETPIDEKLNELDFCTDEQIADDVEIGRRR
jgi:hypothetical protein